MQCLPLVSCGVTSAPENLAAALPTDTGLGSKGFQPRQRTSSDRSRLVISPGSSSPCARIELRPQPRSSQDLVAFVFSVRSSLSDLLPSSPVAGLAVIQPAVADLSRSKDERRSRTNSFGRLQSYHTGESWHLSVLRKSGVLRSVVRAADCFCGSPIGELTCRSGVRSFAGTILGSDSFPSLEDLSITSSLSNRSDNSCPKGSDKSCLQGSDTASPRSAGGEGRQEGCGRQIQLIVSPLRWMAGISKLEWHPNSRATKGKTAGTERATGSSQDLPSSDNVALSDGETSRAWSLPFQPLADRSKKDTSVLRMPCESETGCQLSAALTGVNSGSELSISLADASIVNAARHDESDRPVQATKYDLPASLDPQRLPHHVAMILDGNSRWAERRGLPKEMGHDAGVQALKRIVRMTGNWGIQALTVFAFSTENWKRPKVEVDFLMALLERLLDDDINELHREKVVVRVIGDLSRLPRSLQQKIRGARLLTEKNQGLKLTIAVNYSGRQDILQACHSIAQQVASGELDPCEITEDALDARLLTAWLGPKLSSPDLLIRTSGEQRISNFLLWQLAYTELVFSSCLWPDFDHDQFVECLVEYQGRDRRFGGRDRSLTSTRGGKQ